MNLYDERNPGFDDAYEGVDIAISSSYSTLPSLARCFRTSKDFEGILAEPRWVAITTAYR